MDSWADLEEAVTEALFDTWQNQYQDFYLDWTNCGILARAAIDRIREVGLTAVAGGTFGSNEGDNLAITEATGA
jgi:hypothetical protein